MSPMNQTPDEIGPLLVPVSPESPAGEWLRFDPLYDDVRRRREADDPTLPQGVWQRELKRADWTGVAELCTTALAGRSKDLQLAAWLTEAWVHLHGFSGLERGLRLISGLCRGFWDTLHPPCEDDGIEARVAPLLWVVDRLPLAVKGIPVTAPGGEDSTPFGWVDWEAGLYLANLARLDTAAAGKAQERGMVPQDRFLVSVSLTPAPWMARLAREVAGALAAVGELDAVLAGCCGEEAPSLSSLRGPLLAVHAFAAKVLEERGETLAPLADDDGQTSSPAVEGRGGMGSTDPARPAAILNRSDAYRQLAEASEYLLRTEPHSPVPYLVRRAVSWGHMSLAELLQELLQKNADLGTLYTLLGIKRTS